MTDLAKDLQERFDFAAYHFMSRWEHDPAGVREMTEAEERMAVLFEKLRDTIDQIPAPVLARTRELCEFVGPEQFEQALCKAIRGVSSSFVPTDASDFIKVLNLSLSFLQAA